MVTGPGTQYRLIQEAVTDAASAYHMQDVTPREDYALRFLSPSGYRTPRPWTATMAPPNRARGPMPTRACW